MEERIQQELLLLRSRYSALEYVAEGHWVRIPGYPLPKGWSATSTDVAFPVPVAFPGTPPYGIYAPVGLTFNGQRPANYSEPAGTQPPFGGTWGVFSWAPADGAWRPTADPATGSNLLNWVVGFGTRFREGK